MLEWIQASTLAEIGDEALRVAGLISRRRLAIPVPPGLPRLRERTGTWVEQL